MAHRQILAVQCRLPPSSHGRIPAAMIASRAADVATIVLKRCIYWTPTRLAFWPTRRGQKYFDASPCSTTVRRVGFSWRIRETAVQRSMSRRPVAIRAPFIGSARTTAESLNPGRLLASKPAGLATWALASNLRGGGDRPSPSSSTAPGGQLGAGHRAEINKQGCSAQE